MDLSAFYGSYRADGWGRAAFEPSMRVSAGLVNVGVIAIDGTKVHANASHHSNLDYEQLASASLLLSTPPRSANLSDPRGLEENG